VSDNYSHSDNSSHRDSYSPRDGIYDGTADDAHDLFRHDDFPLSRRRSGRGGHADVSGAPDWVKAFLYLGALLAVAGIGIVFLSVLGVMGTPEPISGGLPPAFPSTQPRPPQASPDVKLGFGLFIAGAVLSVIGGIGHSASKRH
jgi:hypothetical protein